MWVVKGAAIHIVTLVICRGEKIAGECPMARHNLNNDGLFLHNAAVIGFYIICYFLTIRVAKWPFCVSAKRASAFKRMPLIFWSRVTPGLSTAVPAFVWSMEQFKL